MPTLPFNDSAIAKIAEQHSLPKIVKTANLFVDLVEDIVAQQLSGKVADTIFKRFCNIFPDSIPTPALLAQCTTEELRAVGLSNAKANYVRNIASYALENNLSVEYIDSLTDEEITKELTKIKGVGVWTAQMVLIFSLNRPDVFPVGDLAIQQGMQKLYGIDKSGKELLNAISVLAEQWRPNRTTGTRYVWLYVNLLKTNAPRL
jgi:DNA-3-methyladenine glycosylase II